MSCCLTNTVIDVQCRHVWVITEYEEKDTGTLCKEGIYRLMMRVERTEVRRDTRKETVVANE